MDASDDLLDGEPPVIDPYEVLGLERSATADQVKSAYRKLALKNHPGNEAPHPPSAVMFPIHLTEEWSIDKVSEDQKQKAHETFQSIAFAYAVLSDPIRRKRYDETGSTSESIVDSDGFSWSDFYREQFRDAISNDAIEKFAAKYKCSDEERDDILAAYEEHEGNMDAIYETVMLSDVLKDDERFRQIIDDAIAKKDVPAFKAYTKESKKSRQARIKAAKSEATEAEEYAKELGIHDKLFSDKKGKGKGKKESSEDSLAALIRRNQQGRESFLDNLAAKYGAAPATGKRGKKRRVDEAEPSEEAFQAAAARLKKGKKK
ncbi:DnaJ domain-containing protein [Xylaria cf. heliscus]|nr:DnaJ domain-containing protein [Xylaria cf. heliscus]